MSYQTPITDADLQAYVDKELSIDRSREVEQYLHTHPEETKRVEDYRKINQDLKALYDPVLEETVPAQLMVKPRTRYFFRAAAVGVWMMIGGSMGWILHPMTSPTIVIAAVQQDLVQPAAFAHSIYSVEVRHPVEVSAKQEQHLVNWLSKRLKTNIHAPDLSSKGFMLMGGRLLPSTNRMAAQFMYEREDGQRVTLYARHGKWSNTETAFRFARYSNTNVFYWIDNSFGYALVGEFQRVELLELSKVIYQELQLNNLEMKFL